MREEFMRFRKSWFPILPGLFSILGLFPGPGMGQTNMSGSRVGVFRQGFAWILDDDGNRQIDIPPDQDFPWGGIAGDIPVTGDWNGDGTTKAGIFRPNNNGLWLLDWDGTHQNQRVYYFGGAGDRPVVGDWTGNGQSKIGVYRNGLWILDTNGNGTWDAGDLGFTSGFSFAFGGLAGDIPVVGDWDRTHISKGGVFRQGFLWVLDLTAPTVQGSHPNTPLVFAFGGLQGDVPIVGDWDNTGITKVGVFRQGFLWVMDENDPSYTGPHYNGMAFGGFGGLSGDVPVAGRWTVTAELPSSTTAIPSDWVSPAETLMFRATTANAQWFQVVIENAGVYAQQQQVNANNACYILYYAPSNGNAFFLHTDLWSSSGAGGWVPGATTPGTPSTPGTPAQVHNSQCTLDVSRSWVQLVGSEMRLQLALTFSPTWSGGKEIFVDVCCDSSGGQLNWTDRGSWTVPANGIVPVTTDHYDVFRTGANVHETILNTTNAGNLRTPPGVISLPSGDGSCMWAQPLYVPNVTIRGGPYNGQTKNVLYVATANANVYAYDADAYVLLWSRALGQNNLGPSLGGAIPPPPALLGNNGITAGDTDLVDCSGSSTVGSESGIVGTPAIDLSSNTMYVVGNLYVNSTVGHYIFGIDISSGLDNLAPRTIVSSGSVPSAFTPVSQLQRAGLLLADYTVLVPYGSYGDHVNGQLHPPYLYQGWMFGFNRSNLGLLDNGNYGTNTDGYVGAGIWMSGGGAAFDGTKVYFSTGNNFGDQTSVGLSNSVLQISPYGGPPGVVFSQVQMFQPPQATSSQWAPGDLDLGCSRVIVVPGTNDLLVGGKSGNVYVVDRGSLLNPATNPGGSHTYLAAFNAFPGRDLLDPGNNPSGLWAGFAYWKGSVYTWGGGPTSDGTGDTVDYLCAFTSGGVQVACNPSSTDHAFQGVPISISASFDEATTGLVWAVVPTLNGDPTNGDPHSGDPKYFVTGQLQVYKASDLSLIHSYNLYNLSGSTYNIMKFTPPLVVNGKVYVVTANQKILVFAP
jgi:hypothetical protein